VPTTRLLIFAKYPEPGEVMTRLCPAITSQEAAKIQRACIRLLCERAFRSWPVRPLLFISPDDAEDRFREFANPYIPMMPQGDGDLGDRLTRAAKTAFDEGSPELLIIGTDSPTITDEMIDAAQKRLKESDVVIGPCDDGGFYLIGMKHFDDQMFKDIEWGSDRVTDQAVRQLKSRGIKVGMLEPWYDIDRPADLKRAAKDMRTADRYDAYELLRVIEEVLAAHDLKAGGNS
jgi:rSAM/selenodomain-associated transferase 1